MENHHAIKFGKPSISIGAIYTMAMLVITRGYVWSKETGPSDWVFLYDLAVNTTPGDPNSWSDTARRANADKWSCVRVDQN